MGDPLRDGLHARLTRLLEQAEAAKRELEEYDLAAQFAAKHNLKLVPTAETKALPRDMTELVERYLHDEKSPYHSKLYSTRQGYLRNVTRIAADFREYKLEDINAAVIDSVYAKWIANGATAQAHGLVTQTRMVLSFGATELGSDECARVALILRNMRGRFKAPKPRKEHLTREHVLAIIHTANHWPRRGWERPSIALAQAIQWEFKLRQKETIGEWVPHSENSEVSRIFDGEEKWVRGLRWVNGNITTHNGKRLDLTSAPLTAAEVARIPERDRTGPVIKFERSGLPYQAYLFRNVWRRIANAAGVPPGLWNMDSRTSVADQPNDVEELRAAQ